MPSSMREDEEGGMGLEAQEIQKDEGSKGLVNSCRAFPERDKTSLLKGRGLLDPDALRIGSLEAEVRDRDVLGWIHFNVHGFGVPGDFDRRGRGRRS